MAKTDLLKEAIADAKAVKETAIANAKIALEEAFGSRLESMLGAKLAEQIDDEEDELADAELDMAAGEEEEVPAELGDMEDEMDMEEPEAVRVGVDLDMDGEYDIEGELGAGEEEMEMEPEMDDMDMDAEMGDEEMDSELDMELEEIIKELEEGAMEDEMESEGMKYEADDVMSEDIDAIIESILAEEDELDAEDAEIEANEGSYKMKEELDEAYSVIEQLRYTINEVNLLNAKLLYTNKLFRNFELNDTQKMKVIENFDRAASTREVKLVFSTLSESFKKPVAKKKVVKEGYASKPTASTAPNKEIISEGAEFANRWKKLAGLI